MLWKTKKDKQIEALKLSNQYLKDELEKKENQIKKLQKKVKTFYCLRSKKK